MLLSNLMVITGYDKFYPTIRECCAYLGIEPVIFQWERASPRMITRLQETFLIHGRPEIIISRGALADLVESNFPDIITLRAEPDDIDMMEALESAVVYGKHVGVLVYSGATRNYRVDYLKHLLKLDELRFYTFRSADDIRNRIAEGKRDGMDAMVGGGTLAIRTGKALGIPVCFAETSACSLENALLHALTIISAHTRERLQLETFWNATALICEGILVIEDDEIILSNKEMLHILAAREEELLHRPVSRLSPSCFDKEVLDFLMEDPAPEKVLSVRGVSYLVKKKRTCYGEQYRITVAFHNTEDIQRQERKIRAALRDKGLSAKYTFEDIRGSSPAMQAVRKKAALYAATDANILIRGANGTGKELFAQSIHNASIRKNNPFVAVNCAAIPESLLESELFGYEEGSFSGARRGGRAGLFEQAQGGTLFLDEINSLPIQVQGVLLRAIQEREIRRIGSQKVLTVDIRIISASNVNMPEMIAAGKFRADLYYRLNVLSLRLPPLSERREDILPLASLFSQRYARQYHLAAPHFTREDEQTLLQSNWPGNVRDLENVIHRFTLLQSVERTPITECMETCGSPDASPETLTVTAGTLNEMEKELILAVLAKNNGNRSAAAKQLGISRTTLWNRLSGNG